MVSIGLAGCKLGQEGAGAVAELIRVSGSLTEVCQIRKVCGCQVSPSSLGAHKLSACKHRCAYQEIDEEPHFLSNLMRSSLIDRRYLHTTMTGQSLWKYDRLWSLSWC